VKQIEAHQATAAGACFLERLGIDPSRPDSSRRLLEQIRRLERARKTRWNE
jgi:hypothetical protein